MPGAKDWEMPIKSADSITEMLDDPNASMAAIVMDRGPLVGHQEYIDEYMKQANDRIASIPCFK